MKTHSPFSCRLCSCQLVSVLALAALGRLDEVADTDGLLAITQTRDGHIQLITSSRHYTFNLAWLKQLPPEPKK